MVGHDDSIIGKLNAIQAGRMKLDDELLPAVYSELRRLAQSHLASLSNGQSIWATELVHEAMCGWWAPGGSNGKARGTSSSPRRGPCATFSSSGRVVRRGSSAAEL